jgi:hypothetical protein
MIAWSLKIAVLGALVFVALEFALQVGVVLLARFTGSIGVDASRPKFFIFYLGIWIVSFAIAYAIFPRLGRT